jgi:predicted dehydrogenase
MKKLRFGVLGAARIATGHVIPAIQRSDLCEVVALASRSIETGREAAERLGIPEVFGSYQELLASELVDAVYIPLPNHLHKPWTLAAAAAGKHVLCEKPLGLSAAEAQEMVDGCATAGVALMEAFMYRHHPTWRRVKELVDGGAIGEVMAINTRFSYFNDDPSNIRNQIATGGGAVMDIGCYAINLSRWLLGGEPTGIKANVRRHPRFGVDVLTSAILEFGDVHSTFTVSTLAEPDQRAYVIGSSGRIEIEIPFNIPPDRESRIFLAAGGDPPGSPDIQTISFDPADPYTLQADGFAAAVLASGPVPVPPEDAVANMKVIEAILAA